MTADDRPGDTPYFSSSLWTLSGPGERLFFSLLMALQTSDCVTCVTITSPLHSFNDHYSAKNKTTTKHNDTPTLMWHRKSRTVHAGTGLKQKKDTLQACQAASEYKTRTYARHGNGRSNYGD